MKFRKNKLSSFKEMLKEAKNNIDLSYKRNLTDTKYFSSGYNLIYDNYHIITKTFGECKSSYFYREKNIPSLFIHVYNFLSEKNFHVNEEAFYDFIANHGERNYLTYKELFSSSAIIGASCLYELGRICSSEEGREITQTDFKIMSNVIKILSDKNSWNYEKILSSVSKTEKVFIETEPFFELMDDATKNRYRETLSAFCENQDISEETAADLLKSYCLENGITVGDILFKQDKLPQCLFVILCAFFLLVCTSIAIFSFGILGALLALPSIYITSQSFADLLMSSKEKALPCPRLELSQVPDEGKTAVVISSLIISEKENVSLCENAERFYLLNRDKNVYFTILLDFPESRSCEITEKEQKLVDDIEKRIAILNEKYENKFSTFIRKRKYIKGENLYYGEERKRGAITALINYITEKIPFDFQFGETASLFDIKYLFLLDSDTGIGFSAVKKAVSCALHPLNRPVVKNGCVIKGYGVFQPSVKFSLVHEKQTEFESFISGAGGIDNYESASYDRFQSVFGSGIFCGKGLIDVNLYKTQVIPFMPENAVLSHDMPEGNLLRCRLVSDLSVTDGVPTNPISYFKRLHRWIRGDIQNLIFLKNSHMSKFSDYKILNNVIWHLTPVFSLLLLFIGAFSSKGIWQFVFSSLYLLFPFLSVILFAPFRAFKKSLVIGRRYYSEVSGVYASNFFRLLFEMALIPHYAITSFNATAKSLYRMIFSKKGLLEWKTFNQSESSSKKGVISYVGEFFFNVFSGIILLFSNKSLFIFLGLLWIFTPLVMFLSSEAKEDSDPISAEEKETLYSYAKKIWAFFEDNVDARTNYLPPDNIQIAPTDAVAFRTSPTNIGFYLISCLAAVDFGFITPEEMKRNIENSLDVIEKLEKWKGHLYNWYDLKNKKVLGGRFVSTVDSGNFVTMLVALKEGLSEFGMDELALRVSKIIDETDFSFLYNHKKRLFTIGYNEDTDKMEENCYDLFMSEARTTSYFACAKMQVHEKHWKSLGRTLISGGGYCGMASWSGTTFEYFMPCLFLPLYKNSFAYEALVFAFNQQRKFSVSKLWGTSESGFYAFDSELNYQYKAHGVPSLSLKRYPENERVISPYSSFLTLCINRKATLSNLEKIKKSGGFGQYGFYESIDFRNTKAIVKSYMSHHMGMSIIAIANACFDNVFVKRFMADKEMNAAKELLKERIPTSAPIFDNPSSETKKSRLNSKLFENVLSFPNPDNPRCAILYSGNLSMRISDCGAVSLLYRGVPINEADFTFGETNHSLACGFIDTHGNINYPSPIQISHNKNKLKLCSFEFGKNYSSHVISEKDFAASVSYSISEKCDCFIIETKGNIKRKYSPFIVFEPQMIEDKAYFSAKSFSMMKTKCTFDEENQCFFIENPDANFVVCVQCSKKIEAFLASRDELKAGSFFNAFNLLDVLEVLGSKRENASHVYPLCFLKASMISGGTARFYISVGKTKEQALSICNAEKKRTRPLTKSMSETDPNVLSNLASNILFSKVNEGENPFIPLRKELWKIGVSGDYPIFSIYAKEPSKQTLVEYIKAFTIAYRTKLLGDLFIFFDEEDIYFKKTQSILEEILHSAGGLFLKDKSPGIHLLNAQKNELLLKSKEIYSGFITISNKIEILKEKEESKKTYPVSEQKDLIEESDEQNFISLDENGFIFYKDLLKIRKPYSYILSGKNFGSVVTDSSLGFTFSGNSRLQKISFYDESPQALRGETVYALYKNRIYDLCAYSTVFKCKNGVAIYEGDFCGVKFSLCTFVSVLKREKYTIAFFSEEGIPVAYVFTPLLGENYADKNPVSYTKTSDKKENTIFFYNSLGLFCEDFQGYCIGTGTENATPFIHNQKSKIVVFAKGQRSYFRLGICERNEFPKPMTIENVLAEKALAEKFALTVIPNIKFNTQIDEIDRIFPFLFYQTAFSRFYSKTGYYQNGGAFGFRDQLQDCLSLIYSQKENVRRHIIKASSHQYREGDVMHWWHETEHGDTGVRTTCSDDFLWLPFVVAKYVKLTGDISILGETAPFLISPPLEKGENERYERAVFTEEKYSVYAHCLLAIYRGFENRINGISKMGCCDWNDGFSSIGSFGKGLSLFSSRLLVMVCDAFAPLIDNYTASSDFESLWIFKNNNSEIPLSKEEIIEKSNETRGLIEEKYFINGQYVRCVSDDNVYFGIGETKACSTDILCQAFAVLDDKNNVRAKEALLSAYERLYDEESRTLRLFYPPFDKTTEKGGYINKYPHSIRENGGQYTHAAVWTSIALIECGEVEKGISLLQDISPVSRCKTKKEASIYKNEPYVLSADVSSGKNGGRGGWSWYTGAASWYSMAILEYVLGLKFSGSINVKGKEKYVGDFKCLDVNPVIEYDAKISFSDYTIDISVQKGKRPPLLDGEECSFPLVIPAGKSKLEVFFE